MQLFYIVFGVILLYFFLTNWLWTGLILLAILAFLSYFTQPLWNTLGVLWNTIWTIGKYGLLIAGIALIGYIIFHEVRCALIHMGIVQYPNESKHNDSNKQ